MSIATVTAMAKTIVIADDKTIAKDTAEGKIDAKAINEHNIIAEVLGQFNVTNFEQWHIFYTVRAFDLISKLRAKP